MVSTGAKWRRARNMKTPATLLLPLSLLSLAVPLAAHANEEQKLTASDASAGDFLGRSVAVHDEDILAGAPGEDTLGSGAGAAYVWSHDGTEFTETIKLLASDGAAGDSFGRSVGISHDTFVVGAMGADAGATDGGAVYVFVRSGTSWTEEAKLVPTTPIANARFGTSVAIDEDTVLVGAEGAGMAYVFTRAGTVWSEEAVLSASDATFNNGFGMSVALLEDRALVGAHRQDSRGAAYVYSRSGTLWSEDQKVVSGDRNIGDSFGEAVTFGHARMIVVGAPRDDGNGGTTDVGATYRFLEQGGNWNQVAKRVGLAEGDGMGSSVAVSYGFEICGSKFWDNAGQNNVGNTILWVPGNPLLIQIFLASDAAAGNVLGNAVAMDLCNIVSGSMGDDQLGLDAGAVYLFATLEGSATLVNGTGVNPLVMTTETPPNIGGDWHIEFDMTAFPTADRSILLVHRQFLPSPINIPLGELLLNFGTQRLFLNVELGSGVVEHEMPIPNDPFLVGLQMAAQGVLQDTVAGSFLTVTNGELATIGCHGGHHEE